MAHFALIYCRAYKRVFLPYFLFFPQYSTAALYYFCFAPNIYRRFNLAQRQFTAYFCALFFNYLLKPLICDALRKFLFAQRVIFSYIIAICHFLCSIYTFFRYNYPFLAFKQETLAAYRRIFSFLLLFFTKNFISRLNFCVFLRSE